MICSECGSFIEGNEMACRECGEPIPLADLSSSDVIDLMQGASDSPAHGSMRRMHAILGIMLAFIMLFLTGVIYSLYATRGTSVDSVSEVPKIAETVTVDNQNAIGKAL